ncbi:MAG: hypothetical protein ACLGGX_00490 [Bdellovibrionia bacterium]
MKKSLFVSALLSLGFQAQAMTPAEGQVLYEKRFASAEVYEMLHYCVQGSMTCRTLSFYRDVNTKKPIESFRISFYSGERMVGASEYYAKLHKHNEYARLVDGTFDGKVNIDRADEVQTVEKSENQIVIKNLYMPRLGTTGYVVSDLVFNQDLAYLDGVSKDTADPKINDKIRIEYPRLKR